jgi:hypothetical protein
MAKKCKNYYISGIIYFLHCFMAFQSNASELITYEAPKITYEAPKNAEAASEFELEMNGQPVFMYNIRCAAFAYFSFEGKSI